MDVTTEHTLRGQQKTVIHNGAKSGCYRAAHASAEGEYFGATLIGKGMRVATFPEREIADVRPYMQRVRQRICRWLAPDDFFNHDASLEIDRLLVENDALRARLEREAI